MWVLKLRLPAEKQLLGRVAEKFNVSLVGYPLSYWKDKNNLYLVAAGFMFGSDKNKKAAVKAMKKDPDVIKLEIHDDFLVGVLKEPKYFEPIYDPHIIRLKPLVVNRGGYYIWEMACFDRKILEKVLKVSEKYLGAIVLKFKQEKISNISFTRMLPELTKNQKKAMEIAINEGYYEYPKKIKMEDLARMMNISYSTFQAHLKKAEGKLVPFVYREL